MLGKKTATEEEGERERRGWEGGKGRRGGEDNMHGPKEEKQLERGARESKQIYQKA